MTHWTDAQKQAFWAAHKRGDKLLYCLTDRYGRPCNGGKNDLPPAAPGIVHETESRSVCRHGLHATSEPHQYVGELVWIVALGPDAETNGDGDGKWCSTRREFIGLILPEEAVIHGGAAIRSGGRYAPRADLRRADLRRANLQNADLRNTDLRGATLWAADLWGANLRDANLQNTDLRNSYLYGANLWGANLSGADLSGADLWDANLDRAYVGLSPSPVTVARLLAFGWVVNADGYIERKA